MLLPVLPVVVAVLAAGLRAGLVFSLPGIAFALAVPCGVVLLAAPGEPAVLVGWLPAGTALVVCGCGGWIVTGGWPFGSVC